MKTEDQNIPIPKIIHYCWFGKKDLPEMAQRCIDSWKKNMPDYEIKRWDESNFNWQENAYCKESYNVGLYAFVSDFARFKILYEEGGIYLDTDVEIIKPLSDIIENGPFMAMEHGNLVNPGLGIAAIPKMDFLKNILDIYNNSHLYKTDGSINYDTVVVRTDKLLKQYGWDGTQRYIAGFIIYPQDYFCPLNYMTNSLIITDNTYTIHHYSASWITKKQMLYRQLKNILGSNIISYLSKLYKKFCKI